MQFTPQHVLLIGLRASGKSTLAPLLADRLGSTPIDLDERVLRALDQPDVETAWRLLGERAFRTAERDILTGLLGETTPNIIAAGGGAPTAPGAEAAIRQAQRRGVVMVIYLRCSPATLRDRLRALGGAGVNRPSLTGADPIDEMERVFVERDPIYRSLADIVHEGDDVAMTCDAAASVADALTSEVQARLKRKGSEP